MSARQQDFQKMFQHMDAQSGAALQRLSPPSQQEETPEDRVSFAVNKRMGGFDQYSVNPSDMRPGESPVMASRRIELGNTMITGRDAETFESGPAMFRQPGEDRPLNALDQGYKFTRSQEPVSPSAPRLNPQMLDHAPEGMTYRVNFADGRAVQHFNNLGAANRFRDDKLKSDDEPDEPVLIPTPKGARVKSDYALQGEQKADRLRQMFDEMDTRTSPKSDENVFHSMFNQMDSRAKPDPLASMFDEMDARSTSRPMQTDNNGSFEPKEIGRRLPETPSDNQAVETSALSTGTIPEGYYDVRAIPGESQITVLNRFYSELARRAGLDSRVGAQFVAKWTDKALSGGGKFLASNTGKAISDDEFRQNQNITDSTFRIRLDRKTSPEIFRDLEEGMKIKAVDIAPGHTYEKDKSIAEGVQKFRIEHPNIESFAEGVDSSLGGTLRQVGNVASYVPGLDNNWLQRRGKEMQSRAAESMEDRTDDVLHSVPDSSDPNTFLQKGIRASGSAAIEAPKLYGAASLLGEAALPVLGAASEADQGLIGFDERGNPTGLIPGALKGYATKEAFGISGAPGGVRGAAGNVGLMTAQGVLEGKDPVTALTEAAPYAAIPVGERKMVDVPLGQRSARLTDVPEVVAGRKTLSSARAPESLQSSSAPTSDYIQPSLDNLLRVPDQAGATSYPSPRTTAPVSQDIASHNDAQLNSQKFSRVLLKESVGGNAGPGRAAVNVAVDRSGRIVEVGNDQNLSKEVQDKLQSGEYQNVAFLVNMTGDGSIEKWVSDKSLSPEAKAAMDKAVSRANALTTPSAKPDYTHDVLGSLIKESNQSGVGRGWVRVRSEDGGAPFVVRLPGVSGQGGVRSYGDAAPASSGRTPKLDVAVAAYKVGLLGVKTHARNIASTASMQIMEEVSRLPASIVDLATSALTGRRSISGPSIGAVGRSSLRAATEGIREAKEILKRGATDDQLARYQQPREIDSGSKVLDAYVNYHFRLLSAEDQVFRTYALRRSLEDQAKVAALNQVRQGTIPRSEVKAVAARLVERPTLGMQAQAITDSEVATFNNQNLINRGYQAARGALAESSGGRAANASLDVLLPFTRTPTNIIARILDYTPLGAAKGTLRAASAVARKAFTESEQREFSRSIGRSATGSPLILLGYALASKGLLTGGPGDDPRFASGTAQTPTYAIRIGDSWHKIAGFSPLGDLLSLGATIYQDGLGKATLDLAGQQPMLRTTSDLVEAVSEPGKRGQRFVGRLAGNVIPTIVSDAASSIDDKERKRGSSFWNQIAYRVPFLRETLPEAVDVLGRPVEHARTDFFDPTMTRSAEESPDRQAVFLANRKEQLKENPDFANLSDEQLTHNAKVKMRADELITRVNQSSLSDGEKEQIRKTINRNLFVVYARGAERRALQSLNRIFQERINNLSETVGKRIEAMKK